MLGKLTWRRGLAAAVGALALAGVGAAWWVTPRELTIRVEVPEGTQSEFLRVMILKEKVPNGPMTIEAEHELQFPDRQARSSSFTVHVPRGNYRIAVVCDHTELVRQDVRVRSSETVRISLRPSAEGPVIRLERRVHSVSNDGP